MSSDKAVITFRSTCNDLLISILSLACWPVVPVRPYFSDPAKSTSYSLETVTFWSLKSCDSIVTVKMECERDEKSLRLCEASTRFRAPYLYKSSTSFAFAVSKTYKFSTTNWSFLVHLIRRPAYPSTFDALALLLIPCTICGLSKSKTRSLYIYKKET